MANHAHVKPVLQLGHSEYIIRMEFAAGGARLATLDVAGVLKLWDVSTGRLLLDIIETGATPVESEELLSVSADGRVILLQSASSGTVAYSAINGERLAESPHELLTATLSGGRLLAPRPVDNGIEVHDMLGGDQVAALRWPGGKHQAFGRPAISADGSRVAVPSHHLRLVTWDISTRDVISNLPIQSNHPTVEPIFSGSGRRVAFFSFIDPLVVVDLETYDYSVPFGEPGRIERAWLDNAGTRAAAFLGGRARIWEVDSSRILFETDAALYYEECAVWFLDDGGILVAWSDGNEVYVDELTSARRLWQAPPPPASPFGYRLRFDKAGNILLRDSSELLEDEVDGREEESGFAQHLTLWDARALRPISSIAYLHRGLACFEPCPDGQTFIFVAEGLARRIALKHGRVIQEMKLDTAELSDAVLSPDGRSLLTIGLDGVPRLVEFPENTSRRAFYHSVWDTFLIALSRLRWNSPFDDYLARVVAKPFPALHAHILAVSHSPPLLVSASRHAGICLWNAAGGQCLGRYPLRGQACTALAISREARFIAAGLRNQVILLSVPNLQLLGILEGHTNTVRALDISPDSKRLASAGADSTVRIWDVHGLQQEHVLRGHVGPVMAVRFNPMANYLVSAGNDATFRFWHVMAGYLVRTVFDPAPGERIVLFPDGRFNVSGRARRFLSFTLSSPDGLANLSWDDYVEQFGDSMNTDAVELG